MVRIEKIDDFRGRNSLFNLHKEQQTAAGVLFNDWTRIERKCMAEHEFVHLYYKTVHFAMNFTGNSMLFPELQGHRFCK